MTTVYTKMDSHFSDVAAYAVMKDSTIVGRVLFKFTKSGVCHAYVHEWGFKAITGKAGGLWLRQGRCCYR